ncbi:MAG TPA: substrate-binding domain-containing protein [Xanthobacteraceae bacterium]|nr:substrate-binding domain-containing protein [Xanthobacteraceae bacterium]
MTEIKVLSARAPQMALQTLFADFTRATGHAVAASYGTVGAMAQRVKAGEAADVLILSPAALAELGDALAAGTATDVARAGLAVCIREGAAPPDLATPGALKAALLVAPAVSYSDPKAGGSAAAYFATLLERLGIAAAVNAKAALGRNGHHVAELVADGTAALGISFLSELVAIKGVTIAGPLPAEVQNYTVYAAAVTAASRSEAQARALIAALTRADADPTWRAAGLDPARR